MREYIVFVEKVIDFFLPSQCFLCHNKAFGNNVCAECENLVRFVKPPYTEENENSLILKHRSLALYEGEWKKLILAYKFSKNLYLSKDFLRFIHEKFTDVNFQEYDFIIGVPISSNRLIERGFDQVDFIAQKISHKYKVKYVRNALLKIRETLSQNELNQQQRLSNLKNAFILHEKHKNVFYNKKILLIDDVKTTGATLQECAKQIQLAKPLSIHSFTLAYTPLS
ncbi:MAG: ComF family protein [Deltaproteobacteria bacterium]|nr:ComF family protein [Deltaproteobacteria bacterium]